MRRLAPFALSLAAWLSALGWAPWAPAQEARQPGTPAAAPHAGRPASADRAPGTGLARWLYNPRERAAAGLEALDDDRAEDAVRAFDTAADLAREAAPEEPWALYDAGSARLVTEREAERAAGLLERAAETAPPELAPDALFNLGNARLAAGDPAGAVDAYRQALRRAPDLLPAKRNLEIASKRLDEEKARSQRPQGEAQEDQQGDDHDDRQEEGGQPPQAGEEPPRPEGSEPGTEREPDDRRSEQGPQGDQDRAEEDSGEGSDEGASDLGQRPGQGAEPPALSRFREQPDMTAAQAAALLEAIDHLERSQRRLEAAQRARLAAERTKEKDW